MSSDTLLTQPKKDFYSLLDRMKHDEKAERDTAEEIERKYALADNSYEIASKAEKSEQAQFELDVKNFDDTDALKILNAKKGNTKSRYNRGFSPIADKLVTNIVPDINFLIISKIYKIYNKNTPKTLLGTYKYDGLITPKNGPIRALFSCAGDDCEIGNSFEMTSLEMNNYEILTTTKGGKRVRKTIKKRRNRKTIKKRRNRKTKVKK